jgi:hypothetical protein
MQQLDFLRQRGQRSRAARDAGIELVASRNAAFLRRCREYAITVSIEDVRDFAQAQGLLPTHPNAWGAVFKTAAFTPVGYCRNNLESAHARTVRRWAYTDAGAAPIADSHTTKQASRPDGAGDAQ